MNASTGELATHPLRSKAAIVVTVLMVLGACFIAEATSAVDLQVAETVLLYQRKSGGWPKNYDRKQQLTEAQRQRVLKAHPATMPPGTTGPRTPKSGCSPRRTRKPGMTASRMPLCKAFGTCWTASTRTGGGRNAFPVLRVTNATLRSMTMP